MNRQWLGWKYAFLVVGLVVLALLVMDFNNRMAELHRLSSQRDRVAVEATGLMSTQNSLQTQIANATSESAVQEWAYQEAHWARDGEVAVVPVAPPGATPVPEPTPEPTPVVQTNWEVWLSLFVDKPAP